MRNLRNTIALTLMLGFGLAAVAAASPERPGPLQEAIGSKGHALLLEPPTGAHRGSTRSKPRAYARESSERPARGAYDWRLASVLLIAIYVAFIGLTRALFTAERVSPTETA
jgi:hypothetical protein